ncbi:2Fe-2S iron-sulfur cluster-binding protein [Phaeovulum sp.]|uniref:2Fe-2S iron-sulfur cluster-binding protein n=1 Tax=Phaeovulum sp. TaxID=2934796 RepID=UPI00272FD81F|nr:2Fe-2S iron-sulfur cluster-binding protein [Phaeovulum sp.]MDP1667791.1 2Fe-2S iron-sulfur cluster-binding protein [Phaeovulum sp.]MDZ4118977.1 2Fe-2S iron-sulfur cluster-binding protein [Phaeovulum sp.]
MSGQIFWNGTALPYRPGETVATALTRAGVLRFGVAPGRQARGIFCGIGQCQGCLVQVGARLTEACLLPCRDGLMVSDAGGPQHG